jgi:hypothetical protein
MSNRTKSIIEILYTTNTDKDNGIEYQEKRTYDGSFGKIQVLRTLIGLYKDIVLRNQENLRKLSDQELEMLGDEIEALLQQGEIKDAN